MKQLLINDESLESRVAIAEDGVLEDYHVERKDTERVVGCIFKSRIRNLEPSLQAAFVDIGSEKNAFLHYWDMIPASRDMFEDDEEEDDDIETPVEPGTDRDDDAEDEEESFIARIRRRILGAKEAAEDPPEPPPSPRRRPKGGGRGRRRRPRPKQPEINVEDIPNLFKVNSDVLVQVTKGPIGNKGARVTTNLSIAGRYLVLLPNSTHVGVSRRIEDREERKRLRGILRRIGLPRGMGIICRTVGAGKSEEHFQRDLKMLLDAWTKGQKAADSKRSPCCVYREPSVIERSLRDMLTEDVDEIVADSKEAYDLALSMVQQFSRSERVKVRLHNGATPIFEKYRLLRQIENIVSRRVPLPGGGEICIDETEALIAIDVNTGKNRAGKDHPETILNNNMEAVKEVSRQLRLRDLGGLIVVDFIDMRDREDQTTVFRAMKAALLEDKARTRILPISQLGLVEMTRQRQGESLMGRIFEDCPYCQGKGVVKSVTTTSVELQRRLQHVLRRKRGTTKLRVLVHPRVMERLRSEDAEILSEMERDFQGELEFRPDPGLHLEEFHIQDQQTGKTIR